jgi:hypothetical protein
MSLEIVSEPCPGTLPDPCCYVAGELCRFLEENTVPGRRWACGLRRRYGNWPDAHADPGYQEHVRPHWDAVDPDYPDCGEWPNERWPCDNCGAGR